MANTIAKATKYITEPAEIEKLFLGSSLTSDLEVPNKAVGAQTVKYQHIGFKDYDLGDFDRSTGYNQKDMELTWKEKTLSQDKGDSLKIDIMDDEESMANGIVAIHNKYVKRVQTPAVDKYRFGVIAAATGTNVSNITLTSTNCMEKFFAAKAMIKNYRFDDSHLIFYVTSSLEAIYKTAAAAKGYFALGNWNGAIDTQVQMLDKAKIISVPDDYFGDSNIQGVLLAPEAVAAMRKYQETEYFDKIPGFGKRRAQVDEGIYHDCWVYDELSRGIVIFLKTTTSTKTVTYAKGDTSATGTAPTQAATAPGTDITLAANAFTLTGKTFVGWDDGHNLYKSGASYSIPNNNVTLTAKWKD